MARWVAWSMRLLAAVNTSLVLVGLTFLGMTWWAAFALNAFAEVTEPYFWHFYLGFSGVNLLFLGGLTVSAYLLARLRRTGLSVLAAVLVGELLYAAGGCRNLMRQLGHEFSGDSGGVPPPWLPSGRPGRVKVNVDPWPTWLRTTICPPVQLHELLGQRQAKPRALLLPGVVPADLAENSSKMAA